MEPVTLQINLAPRDFRFAKYLLPHQVRQWKGQVAEILLVLESRRSAGNFGQDWDEGMEAILGLAHSIPNARIIPVDYSPDARDRVSAEFFGAPGYLPAKNWRGGPYYCYFYGLNQASHRFVLHADCDIFFGGGSPTWMAEAVTLFDYPEVVFVDPNSSPPPLSAKIEDYHYPNLGWRKLDNGKTVIAMDHMGTRVFLMDKVKFLERMGPLRFVPGRFAPARDFLRYLLGRNPDMFSDLVNRLAGRPKGEFPEQTISHAMQARGLGPVNTIDHLFVT